MTVLTGRHLVVTGGSQGIGAAIAEAAVAAGARVSLIARDSTRLELAASRLGPDARWAAADVRDAVGLQAAILGLEATSGVCDVLVCCAGKALPGRFLEVDGSEFEQQMTLNYLGTVNAVRAVLPGMVERGQGHLVLTSSLAGLLGVVGYTGYSPTKWAIRGLAESLRYEVEPRGVRVSLLYPPDTDTPGFAEENTRKPVETVAVSGSVKPVAASVVARATIRGIERNRQHIAADPLTRVMVRWAGPLEPALRAVMRRQIAGALRAESHRSSAKESA